MPRALTASVITALTCALLTREAAASIDYVTGGLSAERRPTLAFMHGLLSNPTEHLLLWLSVVCLALELLRRSYRTHRRFIDVTASRFHQLHRSRIIEGVRWHCRFRILIPRWISLSKTVRLIISVSDSVKGVSPEIIKRAAAQIRTVRRPETVEIHGGEIHILIRECLPTWWVGPSERAEAIKTIRDGCIGALLKEMRFVPGFRPPDYSPPPIPSDIEVSLPEKGAMAASERGVSGGGVS